MTEYTDPTSCIKHIYAEQNLNVISIAGSNYSLHIFGNKQTDANGLVRLQKYVTKPLFVRFRSNQTEQSAHLQFQKDLRPSMLEVHLQWRYIPLASSPKVPTDEFQPQ